MEGMPEGKSAPRALPQARWSEDMLGTALFRDSDLYEMYNGRRLQAHLHRALPDNKFHGAPTGY